MANILDKIVEFKRREVRSAIDTFGESVPDPDPSRIPTSMSTALAQDNKGIIAEFKRRSPSKGEIHPMADVAKIVPGYEENGAAACSILTDTPFFGGAVTDLMVARQRVSLPLLRKEFIIHPRQIEEARAIGADAILLIAAILSRGQVEEFTELAHSRGLEVLFEIHNELELEKYYPAVDMVGVNNRDLTTFDTDPFLCQKVADALPENAIKVAESGLTNIKEIIRLREAGFRGFLIGETFMKTQNPPEALANFIADKL